MTKNVYKLLDPSNASDMIMRKQHEDAVHEVDRQRAQGAQSMDALADAIFAEVEGYVDRRLEAAHERFLRHHHPETRLDKLIDVVGNLERRLAIAEDRAQRSDDALNRITELMVRRS